MNVEQEKDWVYVVKDWSRRLATDQVTTHPDRMHMMQFLVEECGANLKAVEGHEDSIKSWTIAGMAPAMKAIWGEKWDKIQEWNEVFIQEYEARTGLVLPHINVYKKGTNKKEVARITKQASMKSFAGFVTRWGCVGLVDPEFRAERFSKEINVRITNGLYREAGLTFDRFLPLDRPDTGEIHHTPAYHLNTLLNLLT